MPTLNWIGKDKIINHYHDVPFRALDFRYGFRADMPEDTSPTGSGNKIIHGDNLEALKALLPEYEGRIECIYIDPPYNTGNEAWVYNDNVNDPHIRRWLGEVVGQEGEDLTRHDKWACMMYPRLKLMRQLLADDGVIFISIDENELAQLKILCDEIFSEANFLGILCWESTTQPINAGKAKFQLQQKTENILCYVANKENKYFKLKVDETSSPTYPHTGKLGKCRFEIIEKSDAGQYQRNTMKFPILGHYPRKGKRWQIGEETAKRLVEENKIEVIDGIVKKAIYPEDEIDKTKYFPFWSLLLAKDVGSALQAKEELNNVMGKAVGFDTVKPVKLISELLSHFDDNITVLDCFAGSATTAHAVLEQNKKDGGRRNFILVEMMDYAENITAERVKRVMRGYDFTGKEEEEIYSKKLTPKNLKQGKTLLEEAERAAEAAKGKYDKVSKPKVKDDCLTVTGTKIYTGYKKGTGGEFDYYELGKPLFLADGTLNESVDEDKIREYIYYSETHRHLERLRNEKYKYLLDYYNDTGYFFYYEKESVTILSYDTLNIVPRQAGHYVIYADSCTIDKAQLAEMNVTFKKIPRDINRF